MEMVTINTVLANFDWLTQCFARLHCNHLKTDTFSKELGHIRTDFL